MKRYAIILLSALAVLSTSARETINLGNTPWRFTKIVDGARNLLTFGTVSINDKVNFDINDNKRETTTDIGASSTIKADLLEAHEIDRLVFTFAGDSIYGGNISYTLYDASRNTVGQGEVNLSGYFNKVMENDISEIGNTVGFLQRVTGTTFTIPIGTTARDAEITV